MTSSTTSPVRNRILDAASRLFSRDGFRAVGIDTIIAEAGVAKMSLYRHFPSKDDLIAAYLEESNRRFWAWLDDEIRNLDDPLDRLLAIFEATAKMATSPQCLGCTFQGTAAEFPDPGHPGHEVAVEHKQQVRTRIASLAAAAGLTDSGALADQLFLLMEGAWAAARVLGPANPAAKLMPAVRALIDAHR